MLGVLLALVGCLLLAVGYLIRRYQLVSIIAGYDTRWTVDKAGLATWVGTNLILMGALLILIGLLGVALPSISPGYLTVAHVLVVVGLSARTLVGCRRYEKKR